MGYIEIPTRSINDLNSSADINQLMLNIKELKESLDNIASNVFLNANPVDSIHISVSPVNPGTVYGGTWVAFGTGRALVGIDTSQAEFNTIEKTGGAKTHTLTVAELAPHNHPHSISWLGTGGNTTLIIPGTTVNSGNTGPAGGGGAHNNLQPYITVYMWKRTS